MHVVGLGTCPFCLDSADQAPGAHSVLGKGAGPRDQVRNLWVELGREVLLPQTVVRAGVGETEPASRLGWCLEVSPVCRGRESWGRLSLLINKDLGPGTPKIAICLFLLLSPFWHVGICGVGVLGAKRWHFHRPVFQHLLTQKLLSHRGMALTLFFS